MAKVVNHIKDDFMVYAISPKHTTDDIKNTLDFKIDVFVARVEGWKLGIAKEIINKMGKGRAISLLDILFSYFEMVGKYWNGYADEYKSKCYFQKGVKLVFPDTEEAILDLLYDLRNNLYHMGMIGGRIKISGDLDRPLKYFPKKDFLMINPVKLTYALDEHFAFYVEKLLDPHNSSIRTNFEKRFDYDNLDSSIKCDKQAKSE